MASIASCVERSGDLWWQCEDAVVDLLPRSRRYLLVHESMTCRVRDEKFLRKEKKQTAEGTIATVISVMLTTP